MAQRTLPFCNDDDRQVLAAILGAVPSSPEFAFVTFAKAAGKNLEKDYRAADLRGYALRGQDLTVVNLEFANLRNSDLRDAIGFRQKGTLIEGAVIGPKGKRAGRDRGRFAKIAERLYILLKRCSNLTVDINDFAAHSKAHTSADQDSRQRFLNKALRTLELICTELNEAFSRLTKRSCRVSIKVFETIDEELYVVTLTRDKFTAHKNHVLDKKRRAKQFDPLKLNSHYSHLFYNDNVPSFLSNDLTRENGFSSSAFGFRSRRTTSRTKGDQRKHWPLPYRSIIAVPLRGSSNLKTPKISSAVGIISVCSRSCGVFDEAEDPAICRMVADALFEPVSVVSALWRENSLS